MNLRSLLRPWCWVFGHKQEPHSFSGVDSVYWYRIVICPRCLRQYDGALKLPTRRVDKTLLILALTEDYNQDAAPLWRR